MNQFAERISSDPYGDRERGEQDHSECGCCDVHEVWVGGMFERCDCAHCEGNGRRRELAMKMTTVQRDHIANRLDCETDGIIDMKSPTEISIFEITGDKFGSNAEKSHLVFDRIVTEIREGRCVRVSFRNIFAPNGTFLNIVIGQLYGCLTWEQIGRVTFHGMSASDAHLIDRVVRNAKRYFAEHGKGESLAVVLRGLRLF